MNWFEALILGIVQGLTEFLPVSSSGHLEIGKYLLNIEVVESLEFSIAVHGATVLSTIVIFRKDIARLLAHVFTLKNTQEMWYGWKLIVSMIPVAIVGLFFENDIEQMFTGNIRFVGLMLLATAVILAVSRFVPAREKPVSFKNALIIGIAQAFAVIPGISRSGSTIATGLILGLKKQEAARFSFLMVLLPILAVNTKELFSGEFTQHSGVGAEAIIIGFLAAFISGLLACKWMLKIVRKGSLFYFAIYCFIVGTIAIIFS